MDWVVQIIIAFIGRIAWLVRLEARNNSSTKERERDADDKSDDIDVMEENRGA